MYKPVLAACHSDTVLSSVDVSLTGLLRLFLTQSSLDREALGTMVEAYVQKLERVLTHGTCVASPRFVDVIMSKWNDNRANVFMRTSLLLNLPNPTLRTP